MSVTTKRCGWVDNKEFTEEVFFLKGVWHYGKIPKSRSRDCSISAGMLPPMMVKVCKNHASTAALRPILWTLADVRLVSLA